MTVPASVFGTLPATRGTVITPSDTVAITPTRAVYVGGTGHLTVHFVGAPAGTNTLISAIPVGTILPIAVDLILSTGTTATLIVALW